MTDLWKAYETVLPSLLWREGLAVGFPPTLLVMAIKLYCLPRVIRLCGSHSVPYVSRQGIVAGCSLATSMLRALLFRSLVRIAQEYPRVTLKVVVDDVSLQWRALRRHYTQVAGFVRAAAALLHAFELLSLVPQFTKCGSVATSRKLSDLTCKEL